MVSSSADIGLTGIIPRRVNPKTPFHRTEPNVGCVAPGATIDGRASGHSALGVAIARRLGRLRWNSDSGTNITAEHVRQNVGDATNIIMWSRSRQGAAMFRLAGWIVDNMWDNLVGRVSPGHEPAAKLILKQTGWTDISDVT